MDNRFFSSYFIEDRSYVSFIKREIHNLVLNAGFSAFRSGEIDIVISELTSNLIKFAGKGELMYRVGNDGKGLFFEVFCIDNGDGIANVSKMMQDGASTSNTLGQGLGAIQRLSDVFQLYSLSRWGTVHYCKIYHRPEKTEKLKTLSDFGAVQICCPGEQVCGDGYYVKERPGLLQIFMGDGLGHGIHANQAVEEAIDAFKQCNENDPVEILRYIHNSVKKTRGLVASIASLDLRQQEWKICGVGNISTRLYNGMQCKNYASYNGIIGHNIPRTLTNSVIAMDKYQTIIMHSDGIRTRWNLADLPSVLKYNPNTIASAIYKDNARNNDDMTVLVGKINFN